MNQKYNFSQCCRVWLLWKATGCGYKSSMQTETQFPLSAVVVSCGSSREKLNEGAQSISVLCSVMSGLVFVQNPITTEQELEQMLFSRWLLHAHFCIASEYYFSTAFQYISPCVQCRPWWACVTRSLKLKCSACRGACVAAFSVDRSPVPLQRAGCRVGTALTSPCF